MKWSQGNEYEGEWINGEMCGTGVFRWCDGRVYQGDYFGGKKHGWGKMNWPDGRIYEGEWENGQKHGKGNYYVGNKCVRGLWKKGKLYEAIKE